MCSLFIKDQRFRRLGCFGPWKSSDFPKKTEGGAKASPGFLALGILAATPCLPTLEISFGLEDGLPKVDPRVEPKEEPREGGFMGLGI